LFLAAFTIVVAVLLAGAYAWFGPRSVGFAFAVVWLPMMWLGTLSRRVELRLPAGYHRLRRWERDGRVYTLVGVGVAKRLLRRGPVSVFNPHLHLPAERTADQLSRLDGRMCEAEASHTILFVLTLIVVAHAAARGWWWSAGWTIAFDVAANGYPAILQRYNRALLRRRYDNLVSKGMLPKQRHV
jgi:hypothetical protein